MHNVALSKCQQQNIISAFVILFNFSTAAERLEFYSGTSAMRQRWLKAYTKFNLCKERFDIEVFLFLILNTKILRQ